MQENKDQSNAAAQNRPNEQTAQQNTANEQPAGERLNDGTNDFANGDQEPTSERSEKGSGSSQA